MSEEPKQEITNAVLAEQIKGLTKITDERFSNIKESLIRIEAANTGYVLKTELDEVKKEFTKAVQDIRENLNQHNLDDKVSFGGLSKGQQELRDTIKTWIGGLAIIAVLFPILIPVILRYVFHIG